MRTKKTAFALSSILVLTLLALLPPAHAQSNTGKAYMSQSYVDTTIMRAIYILNESAGSYAVSPGKQSHAVSQARAVLNDLRAKAKGDPNERYAAMRIQEVEAQIYLEDEEMRKIADDKRMATSNQIVIQYNSEHGKMRPDFATLRVIYRRMGEVDVRQANNIANLYNQRYRQISREAQYSLEKALTANDHDLAKSELEYCEKNKLYLMISSSVLEKQRKRFENIKRALEDMPRISVELDAGEASYRGFRLSESRTSLTMARRRIDDSRPYMAVKEGDALSVRCNRLLRALDVREDSLVKVALSILDKRGPDAANRYLKDELQERLNLSSEYASFVDQAILDKSPGRKPDPKMKVAEIDIPDGPSDENNLLFGIHEKTRIRAQARADSIRKERDKAGGISINIYTLLENGKSKDAMRLFTGERAFLASALDPNAFEMLELSVKHGASGPAPSGGRGDLDKNRQKAKEVSAKIYALVEKDDIAEAHKRFLQYRKPLKKYMDNDAYQMLEFTVVQSYKHISK